MLLYQMLSDAVALVMRLEPTPSCPGHEAPIGPMLQRLLKKWPKLVVQLVYLQLVHIKELANNQLITQKNKPSYGS